jgi:hypothetical protein
MSELRWCAGLSLASQRLYRRARSGAAMPESHYLDEDFYPYGLQSISKGALASWNELAAQQNFK